MAPRSRLTRSARVRLVVLLNGAPVGHVYEAAQGRLTFVYAESWRSSAQAFPLSISMPLAAREHGHRVVHAYLWGLLPDNPSVVEWWARRYGVSPYRVVDLLAHVGEDCAGAVQLVPPDRVDVLRSLVGSASAEQQERAVEWLDTHEMEARLRELRRNPAAGRAVADSGQFSLAGAQPKTALYQHRDGRWGVPTASLPTNRILKPPALGLDDLAYNEHFCLLLARTLGMPAAVSRVEQFGDEIAMVVERYDRAEVDGVLVRVHQEDVCQAMGTMPTAKYEADGGPAVADVHDLLRGASTVPDADCARFFDALAFTWLIAGTDAHAKNYSILHASGPQLRLAPLYDLITVLPYPQLEPEQGKLAMSVGGERRIAAIDATHWRAQAQALGVSSDSSVERVRAMAARIPDAVHAVGAAMATSDQGRAVHAWFGDAIIAHADRCARRL